MRKILREPLFHFLILGACLFVASGFLQDEDAATESNTIRVNRNDLLIFMQSRARVFNEESFGDFLDAMPADELRRITDEYVREEALYREAKALRLDENDYVARRRLVQQLQYITRGFIGSDNDLSRADLQKYLAANQDAYLVVPKITFTHVFFGTEQHGVSNAQVLATQQLHTLNYEQVPFHQSVSYGDHYIYHRNYVAKDADEISSHFGEALQQKVFSLQPNDTVWHGPFRSPYGFHLVMVTKQARGYLPLLAEIIQRVEQDALQDRMDTEYDKVVQEIVAAYRVEVAVASQ